jgi:hypothetical protein
MMTTGDTLTVEDELDFRGGSGGLIVLLNARSLMNKRDELEELVNTRNPVLLAVTETWLTSDVMDGEVAIQGYTLLRSDRVSSRNGGGVALFVRHDVPVSLLTTTASTEGTYEGIWCRAKLSPNGYVIVGTIYRTPGSFPEELMNEFRKFSTGGHCLVMGDFNARFVDWSQSRSLPGADLLTIELLALVNELSLYQHIQSPTRVVGSCASTLDLVFTPRESDVTGVVNLPPLGSSDHNIIAFHWRRGMPPRPPTIRRPNI